MRGGKGTICAQPPKDTLTVARGRMDFLELFRELGARSIISEMSTAGAGNFDGCWGWLAIDGDRRGTPGRCNFREFDGRCKV